MRLLWIAASTQPYKDGGRPGAVDFLHQSMRALAAAGLQSSVIAPAGSFSRFPCEQVEGDLTPEFVSGSITPYPMDFGSALSRMMERALARQVDCDFVVNVGHDWLPYYLMPYFRTPLLNVPNLVRTTPRMDGIIARRCGEFPRRIAFVSQAQRSILGGAREMENVVYQPFDLHDFPDPRPKAGSYLLWAGRIFPDKGLHNALELAARHGMTLRVVGVPIDPIYLKTLQRQYGQRLQYEGYLPRKRLYGLMAKAFALLQVQEWEEAFGRVTAEAQFCGLPVLALDKGANAEVVIHGGTGFVAQDLEGLARALPDCGRLDRGFIQERARARFGFGSYARRFLDFLAAVN